MSGQGPAEIAAAHLPKISHLPPSFDENIYLYASALTSVMSITCLSLVIVGWMVKDMWCDRHVSKPKSLLFGYRTMMSLIAFTAFIRSFPEMLYLQAYNDPGTPANVQATITTVKRAADAAALWFFFGWSLLMVIIYPDVCKALHSGPNELVMNSKHTTWPRLWKPALVFVCIVGLSIAFGLAKVYSR